MAQKNIPSVRPEDRLSLHALRAVNTLMARVYHNLTVLAPLRLPREGAAIIVCNHISTIDPMLIQSASSHRIIDWMMAKEYMDIPVLSRAFKMLEVIPVDRGSRESGPIRSALRRLSDGRVVGIFPEGIFSTTGQILEFQTGVALLAMRSKVPVYPGYLDGTQRNKTMIQGFFQRSSSIVQFGPAVQFDRTNTSKELVEQATRRSATPSKI